MENVKKLFKNKAHRTVLTLIASFSLIYLIASFYFINHFFFNTVINGVDVSLKAHADVDNIMKSYVERYKLQLIERNGAVEEMIGQEIDMQYHRKNNISKIYQVQYFLKWPGSLVKKQNYYSEHLFTYNSDHLDNKISELSCLNIEMIEPKNVSFQYVNGSYEVIGEVYGNKIIKDKLNTAIKMSILQGKTKLDLNENGCYENPKYTLSSDKINETRNLLNKYVSSQITYLFGSEKEILDASTINQWLSVDENLDVMISETAAWKYIRGLSKKYDTVGITRKIRASTYRIVEVKGGHYGWKINCDFETKALLEHIKRGETISKEPNYAQKAISRDKNDIGDTYVEINITKQHLWFYKEGKIIAQGAIVTGNPNKGNSTKLGVYMLNYKETGSTLTGPGYEAEVTYWMPFNGNIGIHDASWRYSFGGSIYKRRGSHGCINAPVYLAKKIYDNIEAGTPIICYEEPES